MKTNYTCKCGNKLTKVRNQERFYCKECGRRYSKIFGPYGEKIHNTKGPFLFWNGRKCAHVERG